MILIILSISIILCSCAGDPVFDDSTAQMIALTNNIFEQGDNIKVFFKNAEEGDWIGVYPEGIDPGVLPPFAWAYATGEGSVDFSTSDLNGSGEYWIYICSENSYNIVDTQVITVLNNDTSNYGAGSAEIYVDTENGYSHTELKITPSSPAELTYSFYWSNNKHRLENYDPIYTTVHSGAETFTITLNDCLFMPKEANGIEIAVREGRSKSLFISAPDSLKAPESKLLYTFSVISDMHITEARPQYSSHFRLALNDIIDHGNISAIFSVGDNTDTGTEVDYNILLDIINDVGPLPNMYYAIGNHDTLSSDETNYDEAVSLYLSKTKMPSNYYSVELNNTTFIVLGSDTFDGNGTIGAKQLEWLENELSQCDANRPVFIFLHQPLVDTVSGTLYSQHGDTQRWFGIIDAANDIRTILKDYPNSFLFTGHTHFSLESKQPILSGYGKDATFVNCASVGYLWNDNGGFEGGSEGYYVEVYEDYILLKGREFVKGTWCAAAQFLIPLTVQD